MECFICAATDAPLYKVCNCDTVVHEQCFTRLVNVPSHATHCAICKKKYDMTIHSAKMFRCNTYCAGIMFVLFFLFIADILTITTFHLLISARYNYVLYCVLSMLGILILYLILLISYRYKYETKRWCCIWTVTEPIRKIINLPDPIATSSRNENLELFI